MDHLKENDTVCVSPDGGLVAVFSKDGEQIGQFFLPAGDYSARFIWRKISPGQFIELAPDMHIMSKAAQIRPASHDDFSSGANQSFRPEADPGTRALEQKLRDVSTIEKRLLKTQKLYERALATQTQTIERKQAADIEAAAAEALAAKAAEAEALAAQ